MLSSDVRDERLLNIWKQRTIPVVMRRGGIGERLRVRIPHSTDGGAWLQNARRISPQWIDKYRCWELPKAWFNDFVDRCLSRYGKVYIIQPYREQEKCAPACQNAIGHECQCSCMGEHHGIGNDGSWFTVSETFATRWGEKHLACRLLIAR